MLYCSLMSPFLGDMWKSVMFYYTMRLGFCLLADTRVSDSTAA